MRRFRRGRLVRSPLATALVAASALGCATLLPAPPAVTRPPSGPPEELAGHVFDDRNADGIRDPGEPGIPGVAVSNGVDVVRSDADGRYRLRVEGDATLFVVKPSGWMTPVDENGLPLFYYVHKPHGSLDDDYRFAGVEPTGPLPNPLDFPLVQRDESDPFRVIVLSDPQPYSMDQLEAFARDVIPELVGSEADFGMSLGDLVGDNLDLLGPLNEVQGLVGVPWYNVIGNHDHNYLSPDDLGADETYERVYGPPSYAFQYGRVHFVVLDDVLWLGFDGWDAPGAPDNDHYRGGLRPDQLAFVANYLETVPRDDLVVLAMHIPLEKGTEPRVEQQRELLEILSSHPHTLSISGHTHQQGHAFLDAADGYAPEGGGEHHHLNAGAASGSWYRGPTDGVGLPRATMRDGTPKGHTILTFDGVQYSARYKVSRRSADYQMNVYVPFRVERQDAATTEVVVNVFAGSRRSRVEMRIGSGAWQPMMRVRRTDPYYDDARRIEAQLEGASWHPHPEPTRSTHLWAAPLPADISLGTHVVEVRSRDLFGQVDVARVPVRIE